MFSKHMFFPVTVALLALAKHWMHGYMEDVNFPAYHLHFVSAGRKAVTVVGPISYRPIHLPGGAGAKA